MTIPTGSLAPVVVGSTDSSTLRNAIDINKSLTSAPTTSARSDRFWSSGTAFVGDATEEVLEINYASAGVTNTIQFDAARYPQTIRIEYASDPASDWLPLLDASTQAPIELSINESYPPVLADPSTIAGHFHPQHDYDGHWAKLEVTCSPARIQKVRFILQRQGSAGPVDVSGHKVAYSLALQNIDTGYKITSEEDIPLAADESDSNTSDQVFANSADLFGSNLGFSKKTHKAKNLALNTDDEAPLIWKSEPQPSPSAVVNFYADMRDGAGSAQVIDRIFIDPLYLGCSINLYYSNDSTIGDFRSARSTMKESDIVYRGASITNAGPLDLGTWHPVDGLNPAYFDPFSVQINNNSFGFDPSLNWWMGFEWTRTWTMNTDMMDHDIFSCDAFRVGQNMNSFYFVTAQGNSILFPNMTMDNEPIRVMAGSRDGTIHFMVMQDGMDMMEEIIIPYSAPFSSTIPATLNIGTDTSQMNFAGGQITSFYLAQERFIDHAYMDDPSLFSLTPLTGSQEGRGKYNALMRFDAGQEAATGVRGIIGSPAHPYESMNWTPIPRTYRMHRGHMRLPPTKAKFWNLEISNLRPDSHEKFVPVTRQVKFFPPSLFNTTTPRTSATTRATSDDLALQVQQDLATLNTYADKPQFQGTGTTLSGVTNTEVFVASDTEAAERLAEAGNDWRYQQFHPNMSAPRFNQVGPHEYQVETVTQTTNVSYFAGLRQIIFGKSVRTVPHNPSAIETTFLTGESVGGGNWVLTADGLYSGSQAGSNFAQTVSVVTPTQTGLRGLQFAAQQTDAQIIDLGGQFDASDYDPTDVTSWSAYGDGKVLGLQYNPSIGESALVVSRQTDEGFWADVTINYGKTYGEITVNAGTWGVLKATAGARNYFGGGVQSSAVTAPIGGRVHAAVRATAMSSLTAPLYVQIVDSDTGNVVAEAESNVSKNEVKQWYASVDLADFGAKTPDTWGKLTGQSSWQSFSDTFTRANASSLGTMDSGQSWANQGTPLTIVSNKAVVGTTGARSEVNTGTPWGTLAVRMTTAPTSGTHAAAVQLLDLGGLSLYNDGTFVDTNATNTFATLGETISTAHDYNFKFMLTNQVVANGGTLGGGVDATVQPYSVIITTGTLGSDTFLQTISSSRAFTSLRALMGAATTAWSKFTWTPRPTQVRQDNFILGQFIPGTLIDNEDNFYTYDTLGKRFFYRGQYTYTLASGPATGAVKASSLRPGGTFVAAPGTLTLTPAAGGGMFTAGTYFYKVTAVNAYGETTGSTEASAVATANGTITVSWAAVTGATNYNVYRSTTTNTELWVGSSAGATSFLDVGDVTDTVIAVPTANTTNGAGTMQVVDVLDQYGSFRLNVTQLPAGLTTAQVRLAYLDYNPNGNSVISLWADGKIKEEISGTTLTTIASFNALSGPLTVHYTNNALLSSAFKTAHPQPNPTSIILMQNSTTYLGAYSSASTFSWTSTMRGIGGANNGTGATAYTIIEGFNWNPDASSLAADTSTVTWAQVDYTNTRTYGQMANSIPGSTQHLMLRVVQKEETGDPWYVQSAAFFWDPVEWEFSCDGGLNWWKASAIRNDPNGVMLFPRGLIAYNRLMWRVTSYAGRVMVSHMVIRPWYTGQHGYAVPRPPHLPHGPNAVPADDYGPIERDPRWMAWDSPVPHWWWNEGLRITR